MGVPCTDALLALSAQAYRQGSPIRPSKKIHNCQISINDVWIGLPLRSAMRGMSKFKTQIATYRLEFTSICFSVKKKERLNRT